MNWIVVNSKTNDIECRRCGRRWPIQWPMSVAALVKYCESFSTDHSDCRPVVDNPAIEYDLEEPGIGGLPALGVKPRGLPADLVFAPLSGLAVFRFGGRLGTIDGAHVAGAGVGVLAEAVEHLHFVFAHDVDAAV